MHISGMRAIYTRKYLCRILLIKLDLDPDEASSVPDYNPFTIGSILPSAALGALWQVIRLGQCFHICVGIEMRFKKKKEKKP